MLGQHELAPGQATELTIVYNTFKFPGKFEKFVTVFIDNDAQKELRIDIRGFVKAIPMGAVEVEPRKIEIGEIRVGVPAPGVIIVKNIGDAPTRLTKAVSKKYGTVFLKEEVTVPPGETYRIPFVITASKLGRFLDYILIHADARNVTNKGYKVVITATAR